MKTNEEMRLSSLLSKVIINEVSQKLINQLLEKFKKQTKDDENTILSLINKFDIYKEGLDVARRDITKYDYNELKSLVLGKEMEKAASKAHTQLKKKWDKMRESLPEDQVGPYRYQDSVLKSLITKFYDIYPYINAASRDIMKYDFLTLTDFIRQNYGKVMNKVINDRMLKDPDFVNMGSNPDTLLFYIQSYIQNRDRVPRGTKPVGMMTFHELEQLVDGVLSQGEEGAEKYKEDLSDIDTVYEKDNIIVFAPKSKDQCVRLKNGRTWCTSREGGGNLYYNYRLGNERTLYYVIDQDKPFSDLNYASVILVDPYGGKALADGSNSGRYSGHNNIPWSEIEGKIPKLKGLENLFKPVPLTKEERDLINKVKNVRVGENPYQSLGDEKTVEMWLEYNSPKLSDEQYAYLSPELQKKYISLGFDLTGVQLQNSSEGVLSYYVNKKKEKLANTSFDRLSPEDLDLLQLPMMKKLKEGLKTKFAESLVTHRGADGDAVEIKYPDDAVSKYIKLYGLNEFIDSLPNNIESFDFTNTKSTPMNLQLPDTFKKFTQLDTFHASNSFSEIPEVLKGMDTLQFISLPKSNIKEIPEWIADLPYLIALSLYNADPNIVIPPKVQQKIDNGDLNLLM